MNPYHFHGQHAVLEAPRDWDHETEGECGGLPIRMLDGGCLSVWKPTPEELEKLNSGGAVTVWVAGHQPVMSLGACDSASLLVEA